MKRILCAAFLTLFMACNSWALDSNAVSVAVLAKTANSWNGDALPNYPKGQPEVTILKISIPPKTRLPLHQHPVINAGVLIKGELTVMTEDGKILHLQAGDPIVEVTDTWHFGENTGNETAEIIVFYAGIQNESVTIQK